jgi:N4-gp56 family major capsid protein
MALTTVTTNLVEQRWDNDFFTSYVRKNRFNRYMGTDENAVIQIKEDLTKNPGDRIHLALVTELTGSGQTGDGLLEGNEEALSQYEFPIAVSTIRHAVAVTDNQQQFTGIQLRDAAKTMLQNWAMKKLRTDLITQLGAIYVSGTGLVAYGSASAGQRNTWEANNSDRIVLGDGTVANSGVLATDLASVTSSMKLTKDVVSKLKRVAEVASPIIRPVRVGEDSENYVLFVGSGAFRDLKSDLATTLQNAQERGDGNPLFNDGDLMYDGVVIRKIQEIATLGNVGASSARVEPVYLCGAQALGVAWAQRTKSRTDERDYGFVHGVGIHEMRGVQKIVFNSKDNGIVTGFVGAAAP